MTSFAYPDPLSGLSIEEVITKYRLASSLKNAVLGSPLDFQNESIQSNLEIINIQNTKLTTCHNLYSGIGSEEIVVLIHGLGGNLTHFEPLIAEYTKRNKCFLTFDLPGFGESDDLHEYDMDRVVLLIYALVKEKCPRSKFRIIGHSLGCILSLHLSAMLKDECTHLTLISCPKLEYPVLRNRLAGLALKLLWNFPGIFDFYRNYFDQNRGLESSGIRNFYCREGNEYMKLYQFYRNIQTSSRSIVGYLRGFKDVQVLENNVPIHLIYGDKDCISHIPDITQGEWIKVDDLKLDVVELCSHNCLLDATRETIGLIVEATTVI